MGMTCTIDSNGLKVCFNLGSGQGGIRLPWVYSQSELPSELGRLYFAVGCNEPAKAVVVVDDYYQS